MLTAQGYYKYVECGEFREAAVAGAKFEREQVDCRAVHRVLEKMPRPKFDKFRRAPGQVVPNESPQALVAQD